MITDYNWFQSYNKAAGIQVRKMQCYLSEVTLKKVASHNSCMRRDRIVVSTSRCGRDNPGSNPGHGNAFISHGIWVLSFYSVTYE